MGSACARKLGREARLILTDRHAEELEELRAELAGLGLECSTVVAELGAAEGIAAILEETQRGGALRWVVHTAGVSPAMASWEDVLEIDLAGTARLLDGCLGQVAAGGAAVCVASVAGHMGQDQAAVDAVLDSPLEEDLPGRLARALGGPPDSGIAYLYAKRGVIRLCERWAAAWGRRGARLVSLSPGLMDTSMGRLELDESPAKAGLMDLVPLVRPSADGQSSLPGRAEDIADAVAFLCSDAASFVTGCDLRVDGGLIGTMRSL